MQPVSQTILASVPQLVTNELCERKRSWTDLRYLRPEVLTVVITKISSEMSVNTYQMSLFCG
jgi:hypothetical protein